jgi:hypothetical protein
MDPDFQQEKKESLEYGAPWWELGDDIPLSDSVIARLERERRAPELIKGLVCWQ